MEKDLSECCVEKSRSDGTRMDAAGRENHAIENARAGAEALKPIMRGARNPAGHRLLAFVARTLRGLSSPRLPHSRP